MDYQQPQNPGTNTNDYYQWALHTYINNNHHHHYPEGAAPDQQTRTSQAPANDPFSEDLLKGSLPHKTEEVHHEKKTYKSRESEKKRRTRINSCYEKLKMIIPNCQEKEFQPTVRRLTKEDILLEAIHYIEYLEGEQLMLKRLLANHNITVPQLPRTEKVTDRYPETKTNL